MKRIVLVILGVVVLAVLSWPITGPFFVLPLVTPRLAPVLPRPSAIPEDARAEYDFKVGKMWYWRRALSDGCADWYAQADWAHVTLSSNPGQCRSGPGVSYSTSGDELIFVGYWPEPGITGGEHCPESISAEEIARLRKLAAQAVSRSATAAEKAVLRRIDERLTKVDGQALTTDASGWCNDLKPEDYARPRPRHPNLWVSGR